MVNNIDNSNCPRHLCYIVQRDQENINERTGDGRRQTWLKKISDKKLFHANGEGERIAFAFGIL